MGDEAKPWDREAAVEQARRNWGKAVDELFDIDSKVKRNEASQREVILGLSGSLSYLVAAVGALVVAAGQGVDAS